MALLTNILTKFLGNKSERDIKVISPILVQIKAEYENIVELSNDDLRSKTIDIRQDTLNHIKEENEKVANLKAKAVLSDVPKESFCISAGNLLPFSLSNSI